MHVSADMCSSCPTAAVNPAALSTLTLSDLFGDTTPFHVFARGAANQTLLQPGTEAFNQALASSRSNAIEIGRGSIVQDLSKIFNYEVDYDFGDKLEFGNLIVGATYMLLTLCFSFARFGLGI